MSFNSNTPRAEYVATSGQTLFPFLFKIYTDSDVKVYKTKAGVPPDDANDLLTLGTDYTVTIDGDNGGSITLTTATDTNDLVTLARLLPIDRTIEYQTSGDLLAGTLNDDQEYQTYMLADRESSSGRNLKLPENAQGIDNTMPEPSADKYIRWNTAGNQLINDDTVPQAAIDAQLYKWEAEASKRTADNYAVQSTKVDVVTSNGDGTFTTTTSTDDSAKTLASQAKTSETNAKTSETNAKASADSVDANNIVHKNGSGLPNELSSANAGSTFKVADAVNADEAVSKGQYDLKLNITDKRVCTAWIVFDGTDTTIIDSYNISAVTRDSLGQWQIEFLLPMNNPNYSCSGGARNANSSTSSIQLSFFKSNASTFEAPTINGFKVHGSVQGTANDADGDYVMIHVFGGI